MAGMTWTPTIRFLQLPEARGLPLPEYATDGAAGMDLVCCEDVVLDVGDRRLVRTGLQIEMPPGYEAQVRPRSGIAYKHGVTVLNAPGTIDSDYRGEIGVLLINLGKRSLQIDRGDRIAQLIIAPVVQARVEVVSALTDPARGAAGWGSTGVKEVAEA